ncbi:Na+/H+ antiporter NhaA [Emticicia sp. ODNR4P]|nr:Na+/H+ antiporter NhaA [Emticicia sp. ODNR4P]
MVRISKLFKEFLESEKTGGFILICCTLVSLVLSNYFLGEDYLGFWQTTIADHSLEHWINDGLMTIFFLLIGLELKREIYKGDLSNIKSALFPALGAIGGMVVPAGIYLFFTFGTPTQSGAGIPMATDIAFALGVLSLIGQKVPTQIKVFLTALAVIDDLGAILIIAFFYTDTLLWTNLIIALFIFGGLLLLNKYKVKSLIPYPFGGVVMWYFMLHSGIHATITGVLVAFAIPLGDGGKNTPSYILQHFLHKPVAYLILPIFSLANTAILLEGDFGQTLTQSFSLGIALGLVIGKPLGIVALTFIGVKLGLCKLPKGLDFTKITCVGFLAGIGFTMSIFITLLAFDNDLIIKESKLIILLSSLIAGMVGFGTLSYALKGKNEFTESAQ